MQRPDRETDLAAFFAMGVPLLRLHFINEHGACSCLKGNAKVCRNKPGKHPRTKNGVKDAIPRTDIAQLNNCNVGVQCGDLVVVLDVDPRSGGVEALAELEAKHGPLPLTWKVKTGGGGWHFYFSPPHPNYHGHKIAGNAVELKGAGGYVVAPSSNHESGEFYRWAVKPEEAPLAPLPEWIGRIHEERQAKQKEIFQKHENEKREEHPPWVIEEALMSIPVDSIQTRQQYLDIAMALHSCGSEGEAWAKTALEKWSFQSSLSRGQKKLDATWDSFGEYKGKKKEIGTLFMTAFQFGWEMPRDPVERWDLNPQKECEPTNIPPELKSGDGEDSLIDTLKDSEGINQVSVISHTEEPIASDDQNDLFEDPNDIPKLYEIATSINVAAIVENSDCALMAGSCGVNTLGQAHFSTPCRRGNLSTYLLTIGKSAGGKDAFGSAPAKMVEMISPELMMGIPQSSPAVRKELHRQPSRLIYKDEMIKMMTRLSNPNDPLNGVEGDALELWSAGDNHVLAGFTNKKDEDNSEKVINGRLSMCGTGTYEGQHQLIKTSKAALTDGLWSRFVVVFLEGGSRKSILSHDGILRFSPDIMQRLNDISIGGREKSLQTNPTEVNAGKSKAEVVTRTIYPERIPVEWAGWIRDEDGYRGEAAELFLKYSNLWAVNSDRANLKEKPGESLWGRAAEKALRFAVSEAILTNPKGKPILVTLPMMRFALAFQKRLTATYIERLMTDLGVSDETMIREAILKYLKRKSDRDEKGKWGYKWGSVTESSRLLKGTDDKIKSELIARVRDLMAEEGMIEVKKGKSRDGQPGFRVRLV